MEDEPAECFEFTVVKDEDNKDGIFDVDFPPPTIVVVEFCLTNLKNDTLDFKFNKSLIGMPGSYAMCLKSTGY